VAVISLNDWLDGDLPLILSAVKIRTIDINNGTGVHYIKGHISVLPL
jgi:hypothetical protein